MFRLGRLKLLVVVVLALGTAGGAAFALGAVGAPTVESVDNHFAGVSNETTAVHTNLTVNNPNPVGVQLGGTAVDYTVAMNGVPIASGDKSGLALAKGNSTLAFATQMQNGQIPPWWHTHIENGETTEVTIDADVSSSMLGGRSLSVTQDKTIETDIIGQFNSTETRPVNANQPLVSDPVLYINETRGSWDRANLTESETPMDLAFTVYNPKPYPYTVSKIGYEISMNDVTVGEGETERGYTIGPGQTETIEADTAIQNGNLDRWWVTHLERNQVTDLSIDFYLVLEGGGEQFRIDLDAIDYETTIETDIFGNKAQYPTGENATTESDSANESESATETPTPTPIETDDGILGGGSTETTTATTETATDDGVLGGSDSTDTATATEAETTTATPTATSTETVTDDGGILALGR
ncbi:LEA type 2 family protein [Halomicroarcula sp. S1AR25-4]|uniref:LEA type 2 family protein n=1 Tax=Haloarcula sp. S1AR25-4 TaxID=2950538 RepID=UPI0028765CC1|nr:LEA type 2 family protein [Halomicroarcula sp. S1AR25-4]MDS0276490.1 LEA type 2 family protein [Halomicroarcula sp. S1AR25-4]